MEKHYKLSRTANYNDCNMNNIYIQANKINQNNPPNKVEFVSCLEKYLVKKCI